MNEINFLSVDPSLCNTALVIGKINKATIAITIVSTEMVCTEKSKDKKVKSAPDLISRCKKIREAINRTIEVNKPDVCFIEIPSGSKNYSSAISYAISCSIAALLIPSPIQVTPADVKTKTVGINTASKLQMIEYVNEKYPGVLKTKSGKAIMKTEHLADAICAAVAGIQTKEFKNLL